MLWLQPVSLRRHNLLTFMKAGINMHVYKGGRGRRCRYNNYLLLDVVVRERPPVPDLLVNYQCPNYSLFHYDVTIYLRE